MNCKYYKQQKQVSYDNGVTWYDLSEYRTGSLYESGGTDCNQYTPIYRWVNTDGYMCNGTTKYQKLKKQVSNDNGVTYIDVSPAEYRTGSLIEYNSSDCENSYAEQYFTIESLSNGNRVYFSTNDNSSSAQPLKISASTDGGHTWKEYRSSTDNNWAGTIIAILGEGENVMIKGTNPSYARYGTHRFGTDYKFNVYGNIMSLVNGDSFIGTTEIHYNGFKNFLSGMSVVNAENLIMPSTTIPAYAYQGMFYNCHYLETPPQLSISALGVYSCADMFYGCNNLRYAPDIAPVTISSYSCSHMFDGCTRLTTAPTILPATTLAEGCYNAMFYNCSSIRTAPELPATTLVSWCYADMFKGCTNLNYIKCLATTIPTNQACTSQWVSGVQTTSGTFVKNVAMNDWSTGVSGIPTSWVVTDYGEKIYRWVETTGYECSGTTKMTREKEQVSYDSGVTWYDTYPLEIRTGSTVIEYNSVQCGFTGYTDLYMTIESLEDNNTIYWKDGRNALASVISASTDNGSTWTAYIASSGGSGTTIATLNTGDKVLLKGINDRYLPVTSGTIYVDGGSSFKSSKTFNVYGNAMSLISGDSFTSSTSVSSYAFAYLFYGSKVVSAENLILPATTLASNCYRWMFEACTNLITAPSILPATNLSGTFRCYDSMFSGCTSLTTAPELPATTLANWSYAYMFAHCTSLTTAPELPATTLTEGCYAYMFDGCSNLNYVKCLATNIVASQCTSIWLNNVASDGIFVKDEYMSSWTRGSSGIPTGWTVQNA